METLRNRYGSADYRATSGVMREVFVKVVNESYEEQIEATRCPVELVWGDSDDQVPPEVATRAEALFADARLTLSGGVGHLLPIEAPAVLRAAIERQRKVGV
jgi:pimeloyl-ACP methyl ester carboxylesterase